MSHPSLLLLAGLGCALALPTAALAQTLTIDGQTSTVVELGDTVNFTFDATPGAIASLYVGSSAGPTTFMGQSIPVGADFAPIPLGNVPASGQISNDYDVGWNTTAHGSKL